MPVSRAAQDPEIELMRKTREEQVHPGEPALIVTHGETRRKVRPLNREVIVIGKAPGCDLGLLSAEVAPVHCVLVRLPGGWRIRDCSGRATRVNGQPITEEYLRDGDVIQIGAFSFQARLPALKEQPVPVRVSRLETARRRLVDLALRLRARLRDRAEEAKAVERQRQEMERLEQRLRATHQEQQSRRTELDAYARHLRKEVQKYREMEREMEAELVRQRVELLEERRGLERLKAEMLARIADTEATASALAEALEQEREAIEREREQLANEREYIARQREELVKLREASEASKDTRVDGAPARIEAARKLLRELAERRQGGR
jgi:pSer/pThr/pTyr-binding forkhead associated (FHA) protein